MRAGLIQHAPDEKVRLLEFAGRSAPRARKSDGIVETALAITGDAKGEDSCASAGCVRRPISRISAAHRRIADRAGTYPLVQSWSDGRPWRRPSREPRLSVRFLLQETTRLPGAWRWGLLSDCRQALFRSSGFLEIVRLASSTALMHERPADYLRRFSQPARPPPRRAR